MGLPKAKIVGQVSVRGLAVFPDGQNFKPEVHYYVGKGTRSGVVPISTTKVYWFVNWNDWSSGPFKDPKLSKEQSLKHAEGWSFLTPCIENTTLENITKSSIKHRLNSHESSSQVFDGVTLAGDASHPSTPNLGQGACCALEDAIVLAQKLSGALNPNTEILKTDQNSDGNINQMVKDEKLQQRINTALLEFQAERHERTHPLAVQAYNVGMLMQSDWSLVCFLRNWFIIPRINRQTFLQHTLFDVGKLPMADSKTTEDQ
jgi:2-polyprenyl-6-methoxyphenol hydroxylase-like FAD-dependent oxidoreductase